MGPARPNPLSTSRRVALAFRVLLAGALAVAPGNAQVGRRPQPPSGRGLIVGQVVDAVTAKPLRDAIVSISGPPQGGRDDTPAPRILTTADGYFVFRDLPPGAFTITATKQGYTDGASGRHRPGGPAQPIVLADGERVGNVAVRMWRPGAITGTVVDEADEPLVKIRVRAYRRTIGSGRPRFLGVATATTDDRGAFRLGGLLPGEYIVVVPSRLVSAPQTVGRVIDAGTRQPRDFSAGVSPSANAIQLDDSLLTLDGSPVPPPGGGDRMLIYPPTYHPSTLAIGLTVPLTIAAGEERSGIDLKLTPVPARRLSGFVVGPEGAAAGVAVRLCPDGLDDFALERDATTAIADANGAFAFPAVPAGHYALRASRVQVVADGSRTPPQVAQWADVPVAVGTRNVAGVVVTLNDALRIQGRVAFESTLQRAPAVRMDQVTMLVQSAAGAPILTSDRPSMPESDGDFTIGGLSPGRYFVRPAGAPAGWTFKSAMFDGRDLSETPLDLQADVTGIVVTFTDRSSGLRGVVRLPQGQPDAGAIVIAFPSDIAAWADFGPSPRRVRSSWTTATGEYSIAALPPGDYFMVALPDEIAGDWRDAAALRVLARVATPVTIRDGEQKTQELRTRPTW